ncbi:hypothetical protein tloyanaT_26050 [Thalassotalea loyana]|uniref:Uncharacterized protein n=1 Tax=Thalassotalea loyana TaxID=280483 RepID=A0ABQ6HDZ7_9GAMM|nr:hypothetical protein [Thalassotalea loyana]GLX86352.1 hypothetical protein tloyanaT_26050 [Thalassotalea loyana]
MSEWIKLDTLKLADQFDTPNNSRVKIMLSPYDVPDAIRIERIGRNVVIEFRYITIKEERFEDEIKAGFIFEVGRKTGRIYKVKLDFSLIELPSNSCDLTLHPEHMSFAIDNFIREQEHKTRNPEKYNATKSVFESYSKEINDSLAHG